MNRITTMKIGGIILLVASTFTLTSIALGKGNPWLQVWDAIWDLQSRVTTLEESDNNVHIIRYLESTEFTIDSTTKTKVATFTLTPNDPSNNALINYWFYFEYKGETTTDLYLQCKIEIHGEAGPGDGSSYLGLTPVEIQGIVPSYRYTHVQKLLSGLKRLSVPNQSQYTIDVYFHRDISGTAYVQNFNFIVEYVDGLPVT